MKEARVAYLASEYPAISHTFIFREIQALRARGLHVETASINKPNHLDRMTPAEREEADGTLYIKASGVAAILGAHFRLLAGRPGAVCAMLGAAIRLHRRRHLRLLLSLAYFVEAVLLVDWMRARGLVHAHVHFANPAAAVAFIASHGPGIEYSLSVHGPDVFYQVDSAFLEWKVRRARFVRCISHYCRSQIERILPFAEWGKTHIVRCGVDLERFAPRPEPENPVPEVLCVGRLTPAKGQHILLAACQELRLRGTPFHLTLVGDGPDRASLEGLAQELGIEGTVTFTGAVGQGDIHAYYDRADLFVLPSFAEGLPVVLMEAMAKQIPCISTRITGIPELIEDGQNGALVAASDSVELADRMETLLAGPDLRLRLGERARETVESTYDINRNCERMAQLFERHLAGEAKAGPDEVPRKGRS